MISLAIPQFFDARPLIAKLIIWITAEIILSFLGLDDLADYSEFIYEKPMITFTIYSGVQSG